MNEPDQTVSDPAEEKRVETTVEETTPAVEQTVTETEKSQTVTETAPATDSSDE